jgi:hypothetical protein
MKGKRYPESEFFGVQKQMGGCHINAVSSAPPRKSNY